VRAPQQNFVILRARATGYFLEHLIVPFLIFSEETRNGQSELEPNFPPQHFLTESLKARKFRQKGNK
jgi:hypothetical protein